MDVSLFPYEELKAKIANYSTITLLTHLNPDADTLGTALGIYALLIQDKTKRVEVVNASNALPLYLDFLPNYHKIKHQIEYGESLIIACDCGSIDRLGFDLTGRDIINIDHHQSNKHYGMINIVMAEYASASQVAFELFSPLYPVNAESATCFYASLLSDTRYFTTSSMNAGVFDVAQKLVNLGADPMEIARHFTQRRALSSLRILERALGSLSLYQEARIAVMSVSREDIEASGASVADMEGIVDYGKSLSTVEIAIFAMQIGGDTRLSVRSKKIDITPVVGALGGGGHKVAGGVVLSQLGLKESIDKVLSTIKSLGVMNEK